MTKIIIAGAGGHARALLSWLPENEHIEIVGLLDDQKKGNIYFWPILGEIQTFSSSSEITHFIVGIGQIKTAQPRMMVFQKMINIGLKPLPACVSSQAWVSPFSKILEGTAIFPKAVISGNAQIGQNCIINHQALVEHDCILGNHVHISTGALINGSVTIEDQVFVGSGTVICEGVHIGKGAIIGAGICVKEDIEAGKILK